MDDHTLHCRKKHFCRYYTQAFITAKIFRNHVNDCFKINGKQMSKKGKYVRFKNYERKIKSSFMIYPNFESILVSEDNGKQNPDESYTNKYQKHFACSHGYKLVCAGDSKNFRSYLC